MIGGELKRQSILFVCILLFCMCLQLFPSVPVGEVIQKILRTLSHDEQCFTQGLAIDKGLIYESCGLYGKSSLRIVNLQNGQVKQRVALPREYFAEGLTIVNNTIFLLTWKNKKVLIYDKLNLRLLGSKRFQSFTGEGWGLTTDNKHLILSDGSDRIIFFDIPSLSPTDLSAADGNEPLIEVRQLRVYDPISTRHITQINELEYVHGYIYANLWYKDVVVRINASTGLIADRYDASRIYPKSTRSPNADCLNGIAHDAADDTMLLTGKKWPKYYQINFTEMDVRRSMEL